MRLTSTNDSALGQPSLSATSTIHGRLEELRQLWEAFLRAQRGELVVALVDGPAGIGKTRLVESMEDSMRAEGGRVARGCWVRQQSGPFLGLLSTLDAAVRGLLEEPEPARRALRRRLEQEAGDGLGLLTGLLPELELLTGPRPPPPPMAPQEAQQRLELLLQRLLICFAASSEPLVLFMDDLQWAEASSLALLRRLMERYEGPGVLVVCALRIPCEGPALGLPEVLEALGSSQGGIVHLPLAPLRERDVIAMVADLLGREPETVAALASLVHRETGGNPWSVQRFLVRLQAFGVLRFEEGCWNWQLERVRELDEDDGPVLVATLQGLPGPTRALLDLAACLGSEVDPVVLSLASGRTTEELKELFEPALQRGVLHATGLVTDSAERGVISWRFAHDRLHQAIHDAIDASERDALHRRVVQRLRRAWRRSSRGKLLYTIADQLHRLPTLGESAAALRERAELLAQAGQAALSGAAWETAERHLRGALALGAEAAGLGGAYPGLHHQLALALQAQGRFDEAEVLLEQAMAQAETVDVLVKLRVQRTGMLTHANRYVDAVSQALEGLEELGHELPAQDDPEAWQALLGGELARYRELLGERAPADLVSAPPMPPGPAARELALLGVLAPPAYLYPAMVPWVTLRMVNLCLAHGNGEQAPLAFAFHGFFCCAQEQYQLGQAFGDLALELERRRPDRSQYAPVRLLFTNFVNHWTRPLDSALETGLRAVNVAMQYGQFDYAGWLAMNGVLGLLYRGLPLGRTHERAVHLLRLARDTLRYDDAANLLAGLVEVLGSLRGASEDLPPIPEPEALEAALEHYVTARFHLRVGWLIRSMILGERAQARRHLDGVLTDAPLAVGMFALVECALLEVLLVCDEAAHRSGEPDPAALARVGELVSKLEVWAAANPHSHAPRLELAVAEQAALQGDEIQAHTRFTAALEGFAAQGTLHLEGLAAERAAAFHRAAGHPRTARLFLGAARDAYRRWGASAKLARMESEPCDPPQRAVPVSELMEQARAAGNASRSSSRGLEPDRSSRQLVEFVVSRAGASRGAIFLEQGDQLVLLAAAGDEVEPCADPVPLERCEAWPRRLLQATWEGAPVDAADRSIIEPGSSRCLPVGEAPGPRGLLYLEHRTLPEAFPSSDLPALQSLGALALSALVELSCYRDLLRSSRTLELESSTQVRQNQLLEAELQRCSGDLEALREEHHGTLEALLDGVIRVDLQGVVLYANPAVVRITGYAAGELVGTQATELLEPGDAPGTGFRPERAMDSGGASDAPFTTVLQRRDGTQVGVEFRWSPVFRPDGTIAGGVIAIRDASLRQDLERQLRHAQKMEAMGRFAGGMAHDLNNILVPIMGNLEQILSDRELSPAQQRRAAAASAASARAAALVKQVLAFSRRAEIFERPTDLVPIVDDTCRFLHRSIDRAIQLHWDPPDGDFWFRGDAGLIQQVVLNLGLNARDAIESARTAGWLAEPRIDIELRAVARGPLGLEGPCLMLSVCDNGIGMDAATRARVFEPFFTTKSPDQGTGLGLAVVHGIIEQHGGRVEISSAPGEGARFTCYLPVCAPAEALEEPPQRVEPVDGRGQVLLVVDDEPALRELAREFLEKFGYRVLEAPDGEAALRIYAEHGDDVRLVLLDLSMPGIGGPETLRRLRAQAPKLPIVLWSGYSAEDTIPVSLASAADGFLEKPFVLSALLRVVTEVLA
jgi:PAS domain S-box-containing protein